MPEQLEDVLLVAGLLTVLALGVAWVVAGVWSGEH